MKTPKSPDESIQQARLRKLLEDAHRRERAALEAKKLIENGNIKQSENLSLDHDQALALSNKKDLLNEKANSKVISNGAEPSKPKKRKSVSTSISLEDDHASLPSGNEDLISEKAKSDVVSNGAERTRPNKRKSVSASISLEDDHASLPSDNELLNSEKAKSDVVSNGVEPSKSKKRKSAAFAAIDDQSYSTKAVEATEVHGFKVAEIAPKKKRHKPRHRECPPAPKEALPELEPMQTIPVELEPRMPPAQAFPLLGDIPTAKTLKKIESSAHWLQRAEEVEPEVSSSDEKVESCTFLNEVIINSLKDHDVKVFSPFQYRVISWLLKTHGRTFMFPARDICVSAPSGLETILSIGVPIVQLLMRRVVPSVRAVILASSKTQVAKWSKILKSLCDESKASLHVATLSSNFDLENKVSSDSVVPDIVFATPKDLLTHIRLNDVFSLRQLKFLVFADVDQYFVEIQAGLIEEIEGAVFESKNFLDNCGCSDKSEDQTHFLPVNLCSLRKHNHSFQKILLTTDFYRHAERLQLVKLFQPLLFTHSTDNCNGALKSKKKSTCEPMSQQLCQIYKVCPINQRALMLAFLVRKSIYRRMVCFTKDDNSAMELHAAIKNVKGVRSQFISSSLPSDDVKTVTTRFDNGNINCLICPDSMATNVKTQVADCVVSYDWPQSLETYLLRAGSTAKPCTVCSLLTRDEVTHFLAMTENLSQASQKARDKTDKMFAIRKFFKDNEQSFSDSLRGAFSELLNGTS